LSQTLSSNSVPKKYLIICKMTNLTPERHKNTESYHRIIRLTIRKLIEINWLNWLKFFNTIRLKLFFWKKNTHLFTLKFIKNSINLFSSAKKCSSKCFLKSTPVLQSNWTPKCFWSIRKVLRLLCLIIKSMFLQILSDRLNKISESPNWNCKMLNLRLKTSTKSQIVFGTRRKTQESFWWKISLTFPQFESSTTMKWKKKIESN
jgi:hypothetical protein